MYRDFAFKSVISLVGKVYTYVQSEWEKFHDIYFDHMAVGKDVDPAFLAHVKGENVVPRSTGNTNDETTRLNIHMYPYFLFAAIDHLNRPRLSLCDLVAQSAE